MAATNDKTVVVLDNGVVFKGSCLQLLELDSVNKSRNIIPLAPLGKSMWTCNAEAVLEFCRVIFDLYPSEKFVQLVIGDKDVHNITSWDDSEQTLPQLMTRLGEWQGGTPLSEAKGALTGILGAVQLLCRPSPSQLKAWSDDEENVTNRGRIICLTHLKSDAQVEMIEKRVEEVIEEQNQLALDSDSLLQIDHLDLVIVHVIPVTKVSHITHQSIKEVSPLLTSEVHISQSGVYVAQKMMELAIKYYNLSATTVTGIPMKEEQNSSSSANYDVELLHAADVHVDVLQSELSSVPLRDGLYTKSISLRWCTPKTGPADIQQCTSAFRFTPVDVNSRPTVCLTNFLLNGRSVMLEQPCKGGLKVLSHMLTSHGGQLYIHTLSTGRSPLEDLPSISEGRGGRVTDYRITDFRQLMDTLTLYPCAPNKESPPIEKAKELLERQTRIWPLTLSESIVFSIQGGTLDPLLQNIVKDSLTEAEVLDCKKAIFHVVSMETNNETLPTPTTYIAVKGKGPKRDELYRHLWAELERLVRAYTASSSPGHKDVLQCLLDCKKPNSRPVEEKGELSTVDTALLEYDRYQTLTEKEKQQLNRPNDEDFSPPPAKTTKTESIFHKTNGSCNFLSIWEAHKGSRAPVSKHKEFSGRAQYGDKAELYTHLKDEKSQQKSIETTIAR